MIDINTLKRDPETARLSQVRRGADPDLVQAVLTADTERRDTLHALEQARAERNRASAALKDPALRADPAGREAAITAARELGSSVKALEAAAGAADEAYQLLAGKLPNLVLDSVPAGGEDDFEVLEHCGEKPELDFPARDHVELGLNLGLFDLTRGARTSGSRFFYFTGMGARLERAITSLALDLAGTRGFTEVVPPVLVKPEVMGATGFLAAHDDEVYRLERDDLFLVGTSEVPLAAFHAGEILDGPQRLVASTTCFRREAGSAGRDTRGIFRVHQFQKVELFSFVAQDEAEAEHQRLLAIEKEVLDLLELPYRVINIAGGDLGTSAAQKFDCEAWVPSQERYREVTSTSNCTTFQSRRLNVRRRGDDGLELVATLNGTLAAVPRLVVALLENGQRADGSVRLPVALAQRLGTEVLTA